MTPFSTVTRHITRSKVKGSFELIQATEKQSVCVPSECVSVRYFQIFIVLLNLSKLGTYRAAEVAIYKIDEDTTNIVSSQMDVVFSTYNNSQSLASTIHL
jgi:hypothetical protein